MLTPTLIGVYALGYVVAQVMITFAADRDQRRRGSSDGIDFVLAMIIGALLAIVWPAMVVPMIVRSVTR